MYKKTVDKPAKRCYSRFNVTKYLKNADKEGAIRRGFSESPAAVLNGVCCERGIPKFSAHRL